MSLAAIMSILIALAPHATRTSLRPTARAIHSAARTRLGVSVLAVIRLHENGLANPRGVPFGVTDAAPSHRRTLAMAAQTADRILWHGASRDCGRHIEIATRLRYFHSGRCTGAAHDGFVQEELESLANLLGD